MIVGVFFCSAGAPSQKLGLLGARLAGEVEFLKKTLHTEGRINPNSRAPRRKYRLFNVAGSHSGADGVDGFIPHTAKADSRAAPTSVFRPVGIRAP